MTKLPEIKLAPALAPQPGTAWSVEDIAAGSPQIVDPDLYRVRREPRVRLVINHLPASYKQAFSNRAAQLGITHKALFIEMMRAYGFPVPSADHVDARFRD